MRRGADLDIFLDYARRMDFRRDDGRPLLEWDGPEDAYRAWQECSRGRPCDYTGISYDDLRRESGIRWPRREGEARARSACTRMPTSPPTPTTARASATTCSPGASATESFMALRPDGRAMLKSAPYQGPHEGPDAEYPLRFTTGRSVYHFHTRTKTGRTPELVAAAPSVWLEMAAADADARGVVDGDLVEVRSRRGRIVAPVRLTGDRARAPSSRPFHYGYWDAPEGAEERHPTAANELTITEWDPVSKQPIFKTGRRSGVEVRR